LKGTTFGNYRLVADLGQGGMADVILAIAQGPVGFNKLVVIKRLRDHLEGDPEFVNMLVDEARLAARLNHPNIVHTNEVGEIDGHFFMAMEFLEGQPLTRLKRRARRAGHDLSLDLELRILFDALGALHYAHDLCDYDGSPLGVVHRDATPSNLFVTYDGHVKVLDFGIAKATCRTTETRTGVVKGKMTYMPPEQALGHEVDRRADVYSVGVMLWEAAAGRRMWGNVDDVVILGKLIHGDIPLSPREVNPEVPPELDAICRKALAASPERRYPSAAALQADLEEFIASRRPVPYPRELSRVVNELFKRERRELSEIIESQLLKLRESPSGIQPVVVEDVAARTLTLTAGSPPSSTLPTSGEIPRFTPNTSSHLTRIGAGLAGIAVLVAVGWTVSESRSQATSADAPTLPAPAAAPAPTTTEPSARPRSVRVTLRAEPATARFVLDDRQPLENPFVGELPRDDQPHQVRVEARGYEPQHHLVRLDGDDIKLDVSLKRIAGGGQARPSDGILPRPPPPKPARDLLGGDPWGRDGQQP
jgi:serine/threonine-protein kinase